MHSKHTLYTQPSHTKGQNKLNPFQETAVSGTIWPSALGTLTLTITGRQSPWSCGFLTRKTGPSWQCCRKPWAQQSCKKHWHNFKVANCKPKMAQHHESKQQRNYMTLVEGASSMCPWPISSDTHELHTKCYLYQMLDQLCLPLSPLHLLEWFAALCFLKAAEWIQHKLAELHLFLKRYNSDPKWKHVTCVAKNYPKENGQLSNRKWKRFDY